MRILFIGAHPDDIESGAGGFIARSRGKNEMMAVVFSNCEEQTGNEGITEEFKDSMQILGIENFKLFDFPNTRLPENEEAMRNALEKIRNSFKPELVVTHNINNTHQDHKAVAEASIRVFRHSSVFMYEDLKSTPKFVPNVIVPLTNEQLESKLKALECYKTQTRRYYFDMDYIRSIARVRGKLINRDFGEAFEIYQYVWDI